MFLKNWQIFKRNLEREVSNYAKNEVPKILILSYKPEKYKSIKNCKIIFNDSTVPNFLDENIDVAASIPLNIQRYCDLRNITILCDSIMILDDIVNLNITFKKLILIETISMINKTRGLARRQKAVST